jgi:hypothetical protein
MGPAGLLVVDEDTRVLLELELELLRVGVGVGT